MLPRRCFTEFKNGALISFISLGVKVKLQRRGLHSFTQDYNGIKENRKPKDSYVKLNCGICFTNKIDIMFYKCGHLYCCENCAVKLNGTCPILRIKYDELVKIYLS